MIRKAIVNHKEDRFHCLTPPSKPKTVLNNKSSLILNKVAALLNN